MKKTFTRVLTLVLTATLFAGALAACGSKKDTEPTTTTTPEATPSTAPENNNNQNNDNQNNDNNNQNNDNNQNAGSDVADNSVAAYCMKAYKDKIAAGASVEEALTALTEDETLIMLMLEHNLEYIQGFNTEITGYTDVYALLPAFGFQPFVMYSFAADDAEAFKTLLDEHADKRWNICTEADDKIVEIVGDRVVIVMAPHSFDE